MRILGLILLGLVVDTSTVWIAIRLGQGWD